MAIRIAVLVLIAGTAAYNQDCVSWSLRATSGPSSGFERGLAFDGARGRTVMYSGGGMTWEWNGASWVAITVPVWHPLQDREYAMVYDSVRGRTVLFGGRGPGNEYRTETWLWDGASWASVGVAGPSVRSRPAMAFDTARGVTVLFGGTVEGGFSGETWEWNGTAWALRATNGPAARTDHAMAFDAQRQRTVLFGGTRAPLGAPGSDTWEWDGTEWVEAQVGGPQPRYGHAMAYDSARGRTMIVGGVVAGVRTNDTWSWEGTAWVQEFPSVLSLPDGRSGHSVAYDSLRDCVVLFGGVAAPQNFPADTWEYTALRRLVIDQQPQSQTSYSGRTTVLTVGATGTAPSFQWRREGVDLVGGGRFLGVTSSTLVINPTHLGDSGSYDVVISSLCGEQTSAPAQLTVLCYPNCDGSTGSPMLTPNDFVCFVNEYAAGNEVANCDGSTGSPALTANDFLCFVNTYAAGCS